jgi:hypothetical protein
VSEYPQVYENEYDGTCFAAIEDEPDMASVCQRYADQMGLIVVFIDKITSGTQECECQPTSEHCPDADGKPCKVRTNIEGWSFTTYDDPSWVEEETTGPVFYPHDEQGRTLILGHRFDSYHHSRVLSAVDFGCHESEQAHYRERIEAPGQVAAFGDV